MHVTVTCYWVTSNELFLRRVVPWTPSIRSYQQRYFLVHWLARPVSPPVVIAPVYLSIFCAQDYTAFLAGATKTTSDRTTTGLAVHQAGLPHFDLLVTPRSDILFFNVLAATFGLPALVGRDDAALETLRLRTNSQRVTTAEELDDFVPSDQMKEQIDAMKVRRVKCMVYCGIQD